MKRNDLKDEALKELFRLKLKQLNEVRHTFDFTHPIANEVIWLFSTKFDYCYQDHRMLSILHDSYEEFQTMRSRIELSKGLEKWIEKNGYTYDQVFAVEK